MSVAVSRNIVRRQSSAWDLAFGWFLFIVMTQLYRPIAVVLGLGDLTLVTGGIAAVCLIYVMLGRTRSLVPVNHFPLLVLAIVGLPLFSLIYAEQKDWRGLLIQIHYLMLVLGAAKCFQRNRSASRLVIAALAVSVVAMIISIFWPETFAPMAAMAGARFDYQGRGSGLFLQPNLIAHNLVLMMLMFYLVRQRGGVAVLWSVALLFWTALFLTGSRGGLVAGSLFLIGLVLVERKFSDPRFLILPLFAGFVALGGWALWDLLSLGGGVDISQYTARFASVFSGDIVYDGSVMHRMAFQEAFAQRILEQPIFGYGLGAAGAMVDQGRLLGSAHNQFLDLALQYGLLGLLVMIAGAMRLFQQVRDTGPEPSPSRAVLVVATLSLSMMATNMVLDMQNFYILLGVIFGVSGRTTQVASNPRWRNAFLWRSENRLSDKLAARRASARNGALS